jgi:methyl-accepting chemotaxis protein
MKNWKIGFRMAAGFGAVICIALALVIFAYARVSRIDKDVSTITQNHLPGMYLVGQLEVNTWANYSSVVRFAAAKDRQEMAETERQIQESRDANTKVISELEKTIVTEKGKALLENLRQRRAPFSAALEDVLRLKKESKDRESQAVLDGPLKQAFAAYMEASKEVAAYKKSASEEGGRDVEASVGAAQTGIWVALGLALAIGIGIAAKITRGITGPLAVAMRLVDTIAQGDLTEKAKVDSGDEVGQMVAAMNGMVDNLEKTMREVPRRRTMWRAAAGRWRPRLRRFRRELPSRPRPRRKPLRRWKRWRPASSRTPTTPGRPIRSPPRPPTMRARAGKRSARPLGR